MRPRFLQSIKFFAKQLQQSSERELPTIEALFSLRSLDFEYALSTMIAHNYVAVNGAKVSLLTPKNEFNIARDILNVELGRNPNLRKIILVVGPENDSDVFPNEYQLLIECKLLNWDDYDVQLWWRSLRAIERSSTSHVDEQSGNDQTGLIGESLSWDYEKRRLPNSLHLVQWVSNRYGDSVGFDILSVKEDNSVNEIFIEVKSSTKSWDQAVAYLTFNEYRILKANPQLYNFHLWSEVDSVERRKLVVVRGSDLLERIVLPSGTRWEGTISIPFAQF